MIVKSVKILHDIRYRNVMNAPGWMQNRQSIRTSSFQVSAMIKYINLVICIELSVLQHQIVNIAHKFQCHKTFAMFSQYFVNINMISDAVCVCVCSCTWMHVYINCVLNVCVYLYLSVRESDLRENYVSHKMRHWLVFGITSLWGMLCFDVYCHSSAMPCIYIYIFSVNVWNVRAS